MPAVTMPWHQVGRLAAVGPLLFVAGCVDRSTTDIGSRLTGNIAVAEAYTSPASGGIIQPASAETTQFLMDAAARSLFQIKAGKLAPLKTESLSVRRFASLMVQAHSRVYDRIVQMAQARGLTLPVELSARHRNMYEKLDGLPSYEFDEGYSAELSGVHREAVQAFQEAADRSGDPALESFAQSQLPALRDQLRVSQTLPGTPQG